MSDDAPGRIDVSRAVADGWSAMLEQFPLWLGIAVLGMLSALAAALTVIGVFLLVPVIAWGGLAALIAAFDGRGELRLLFSGFREYGRALGSMWGIILLSIAVSLPGQAAVFAGEYSGDPRLAALGALINLAWNLALLPLGFAAYFAVDRRVGPLEAFRRSWSYTQGQWLSIFLLTLAGLAIAILGLLALVIGLIPASAVIAFMWISAYRQLTRTDTREGSQAPRQPGDPAAASAQ
jgi:hypothetical protein